MCGNDDWLTWDACVRHLQIPGDIGRTGTARAQFFVGDGHWAAWTAATPELNHVPDVGRAAQVTEIHLHAPAHSHPAVLRRPDVDSLGRRLTTGIKILERAVFPRLFCTTKHHRTIVRFFICMSSWYYCMRMRTGGMGRWFRTKIQPTKAVPKFFKNVPHFKAQMAQKVLNCAI